MTLIFVKDEKRTIKSLCAMIDNAPRMDVFKLEELELDGTKGNIMVLSKALGAHPCVEEFNIFSVTLTDATLSLDQVVSVIMDSVPDLRHIKLEKVPVSPSALTTAGYCTSQKTPMDGNPCLEEFHMTTTTLTDASLSLDEVPLMTQDSVPELRHVELETEPASSSTLAAVGYCTNLDTPIVPKSGLTDKDAAQSPSIPLSDIPLSDTPDNGVSDLGCDALATAKDKNSVIQTVHLEGGGEISCEQRSQVETTSPKRSGGNAHAA
jgi:hypothetical protein